MGSPTFNRLRNIFDPRRFQQMGQQGVIPSLPSSRFGPIPPILQTPSSQTPPDEYVYDPLTTAPRFGPVPNVLGQGKVPHRPHVPPSQAEIRGLLPGKPKLSADPYPTAIEGDEEEEPEPDYVAEDEERPTKPPNSTPFLSSRRLPSYGRPQITQTERQRNRIESQVGKPFFADELHKAPKTEEEEINDILRGYKPETEMSDRVNQLLASFPQRQGDFSKWRKFGSFLVGAGLGPEAQEKATYAPYYRELADWKTQIEPALKGAELEKQTNVNLRQLAYQQRQSDIAQQRADATTRDAATREQRMLDQAEASKAKVEIDALRARGGTPYDDPTSNTVWMLYKDGSKKDTGIPSRLVTPAQRQEWELEKIRVGEQERRTTNELDKSDDYRYFYDYPADGGPPVYMEQSVRTGQYWPMGQRPATEPRPTPTTQPANAPYKFSTQPSVSEDIPVPGGLGGTTQPTTPTTQQPTAPSTEQGNVVLGRPRTVIQDREAMKIRAEELISRDYRLRKIIKFDRTGIPVIKDPPWLSGITPEEKQAAADYIFGSQGPQNRPTAQPATTGKFKTKSGTSYERLD